MVMKGQFPQSVDFNQTLVFSVFGHLLILTAILFLPKPTLPENSVVPAFMVNLVSEPAGFKATKPKVAEPVEKAKKTEKKKKKIKKKKVEKKPEPRKAVKKNQALKKTKKVKASKPVEVKKVPAIKAPKTNVALDALNKLEGSMAALATPSVVQELDQVARLEKPKVAPQKPVKKKPVIEKTFRELETLKNKKVKKKQAVAPIPLEEDSLKGFDKLEMKESLPEKPQKKVSVEKKKKLVPENKDSEIKVSPSIDLLKQLDQLAKLDAAPISVPKRDKGKPEPEEESQGSDESYNPILEKLGSLSVESEPVRVEVSSAKLDSSSFQSKLRNLPKASTKSANADAGDSYVVTDKKGDPGADAQSLYVGGVQEKIYKNWREPLAQEHNREVVVSFYIFSSGNIDKPVIKKSSGVEALDSLAVRAVLDSVPFPAFPKELKMSNLHLNINFKYVPKD